MSMLTFIAATFAVAYVATYLSAVGQIRRKHNQPAYPQFDPRSPESMPPAARQRFERDVPRLEALGFDVVAYLHHSNLPKAEDRRAEVCLVLLRNEETGDLAQLAQIFVQVKHVNSSVGYATFVAELPGAAAVITSNSPNLGVFKPDPRRRGHLFTGLEDLRRLFRVHRALVERDAPGRKGILPSPGMEIPHLCDAESKAMRRQVECGYLYLDEASGMCRHTWKGALVMTGKLMYGVKDVRAALVRSRARATLSSLGSKAA
jgi:hypothetical protein